MEFRDRIVELRKVPASEIHPSPRNWRTHPESQKAALRGMLRDVGFAGAVLSRVRDDGELEALDGHLRTDVAEGETVPVLVTDLAEDEANKVLITFDALGSMAEGDPIQMEELLRLVQSSDEDVSTLLDLIAQDYGIVPPAESDAPAVDEFKSFDENIDTQFGCPQCGYHWSGSPKP